MREMNCYKESEGTTIPTGYPPEVYCEEDLFKTARPLYEAAKKRVAEKNAVSDGKIKYGIGVSLGVYGCGLDGVDTSNAFAELNPDGTVTMYAAWEDHGQVPTWVFLYHLMKHFVRPESDRNRSNLL